MSATALPPRRILCVEDDPAFRAILTQGLKAYSFAVTSATHGEEALALFRTDGGKFDAILTDHDMPRMNGLNLCRSLRTLGYGGRIIVMSGRLSPSDCRLYADYSISGFFQKPFEISLLATMLLSR